MTKLRDYFDEMVVYKDLRNNSFFSSLGLPAFLRDYLLKTFSDEYGNFDMQQVSAFVKKYIPKKEDWMSISAIVEKLVKGPDDADTRDAKAIKKIATAYLKLLFPNVQSEMDVDKTEFRDYCLIPAMKMRRIIKLQQGFIDTEYKGKDVPFFTVDD